MGVGNGLVEGDQFSAVFNFRISGPVCPPNMSQIMPLVNACPIRMADLRIAINAGAPMCLMAIFRGERCSETALCYRY